MRCPLGRSVVDAGGRIFTCGAEFKSNGFTHRDGGYGGAVAGRVEDGHAEVDGADSMCSMRAAVRSTWLSSLSIAALDDDFQASSAVSLSSTHVMAASNPSNFFASSSTTVVMVASNLAGFRSTSSWAPQNRAAFLF